MFLSSSADLKRPSSATAVAQGMFCAPGMCPPRWAPSCGRFSGARSSPAYSFGERTSTILVPFPATTFSRTLSRSARIDASGVPARYSLFGDPLRAAAIHELHVLVAVILEKPEKPRREPVVVVAVRDDRRGRRHAVLRKQPLELLLVQKIADRLLLKVGLPVEPDRAGNMALLVCACIDVDLEDADVRILRVFAE